MLRLGLGTLGMSIPQRFNGLPSFGQMRYQLKQLFNILPKKMPVLRRFASDLLPHKSAAFYISWSLDHIHPRRLYDCYFGAIVSRKLKCDLYWHDIHTKLSYNSSTGTTVVRRVRHKWTSRNGDDVSMLFLVLSFS
jgi:hypothetical protein